MSALAAAQTPVAPDSHQYYLAYGYAVARQVVPRPLIAALLDSYQSCIVPSRYPFFRQNTNAYERNEVTADGYVRQSFLDIHDYARYPEFSALARDIYCCEGLLAALRQVAGCTDFRLMQTMLFDLNTATPAHQDWYYLDSVPGGQLIGAWIALEDIDELAGRFYVMRESHWCDFQATQRGRTHADWLGVIRRFVDEHPEELVAPALQAGDVVFWNSRTVHGSLPTQDPAYSRKSLTGHYLPAGLEFGNLFATKRDLRFKQHGSTRFYRNQPDYSPLQRFKFSVKVRLYNHPRLRESTRTLRDVVTRLLA